MRISAINLQRNPQHAVSFAKKEHVKKEVDPELKEQRKQKLKKVLPMVIGGVAVGTAAIVAIAAKKQTNKALKDLDKSWIALASLAGLSGYELGKITNKDKDDIVDTAKNWQTPLQKTTGENARELNRVEYVFTNPTLDKYVQYYNGIPLLKQDNVMNRNNTKYEAAIEHIQKIGKEKLTSKDEIPSINKEHPSIWSITSEFSPVKEGGLGDVPPEIRNNFEKKGVDMPAFMPLYLGENASLINDMGEYKYVNKKAEFKLEKVLSFKMDVYQNGKINTIPVDIFLNTDKEGRKLVFIKCDKYFDGTIYETNAKTEESEKFAVMSKAVYELAKMKIQGAKALKDVEIVSENALNKINAPDGMILNDWQAAPVAALMRYKAGMENAHGQITDSTKDALENMRMICIGHNVTYQGDTQSNNDSRQRKAASANILNTLFDKYAYDIVSNAKSGATEIDPEDKGLEKLDNVLLMNYNDEESNHTRFLNMGITLSDCFHPVSENYAQELISLDRNDLSYSMQWALVQKHKAGKLIGIINGNDFENLNIEATNPKTEELIGFQLKPYKKDAPLDEILKTRAENKIKFYNDYILPFSESKASSKEKIDKVKKYAERLEFVQGKRGTKLPVLSDKELLETPVLMSGGRLVSQKGMDLFCEAVKILFENWEKDFPNKPKPIFYIAGQDNENGKQRAIIEKYKDTILSEEDSNRVLFAHGYVPMSGMMASSDFFTMSSWFEPCGLTQSQSLAVATPVIASAVGGLVDTINRNGDMNGVLTDKNKKLDAQEYYEALKKGLDIFFNNKEKYNTMVKNSIAEDFSWLVDNGPISQYAKYLGVNIDK